MFSQYLLSVAFFSGILPLPEDASPSRWTTQEQRKNVELYSELPIDTDALWKQLDDVSAELDVDLNIRSSGEPIQLMLFRNHQSYLEFLAPKIPEARHRKAIYFRNGDVSQIYAYQSRSLVTDLRHEMTHAILHQHLPFIPLWLDEGLAEYFEEEATTRLSTPRIATVQWKARVGVAPSLVLLESIPSAEKMDAAVYRDSWAWVSFLLNGSPETRDVLHKYLESIHAGEAPGPLSSYAQTQFPDFEGRANSYFKRFTFRVVSGSSHKP